MGKIVLSVIVSILILGSLGLTQLAFAVPTNVAHSNQVTCDPLSVPDIVDEFGKGALSAPPGPFPSDEEITTSDDAPVTASACTTVPPSGGPHAVVNITNESPFTFEELWYVADPETSLTNIDGLVSIPPSAPVLAAFRIDSMFSPGGCGVNCPLLAETLTTDGIFEPGETWMFQIDDYFNTAGLTASEIDSIGFPSASPPSSGSIIAFDNIIFRMAKDQFFEQTANNVQPPTPIEFGFSFGLFTDDPSDFVSVVLNGAPGGPQASTLAGSDWAFFHAESSKAALDAAFPNQVYTLSTSGGNLGTFNELVDLSVDPERYPNEVPFLTGNSFNDLQVMDPTQDITVTWNLPSSGGPQVTGVGFRVGEEVSDNILFDFGTGDTSITSTVIPGNTLNPNESYFAALAFETVQFDPLDSFPTGEVSTTFAFITEVGFSTSSQMLVGGTSIPIDTTALLIAGFNVNSIWMIPTVLGLVGAGIVIYKFKRKSVNVISKFK